VDVIVTLGEGVTEARRATSTIPIVAYVADPVSGGLRKVCTTGATAAIERA
jgi:hypothetical protein